MPRANNRSAFPFKKEAVIGTAIWLTYAAPAAVLYLRPKPQVAQWCWIAVGAATVFIVLPLLYRMWLIWPVSGARTSVPVPEQVPLVQGGRIARPSMQRDEEPVELPLALPSRPADRPKRNRSRATSGRGAATAG